MLIMFCRPIPSLSAHQHGRLSVFCRRKTPIGIVFCCCYCSRNGSAILVDATALLFCLLLVFQLRLRSHLAEVSPCGGSVHLGCTPVRRHGVADVFIVLQQGGIRGRMRRTVGRWSRWRVTKSEPKPAFYVRLVATPQQPFKYTIFTSDWTLLQTNVMLLKSTYSFSKLKRQVILHTFQDG